MYGEIVTNSSSGMTANPARVSLFPGSFVRKPHKLAHYGSATDVAVALPLLSNGNLVLPADVMEGGVSGYKIPWGNILEAKLIASTFAQKAILRATASEVDCRSTGYMGLEAHLGYGPLNETEEVVKAHRYFDADCDVALDTKAERVAAFVAAVNAKTTRVIASIDPGDNTKVRFTTDTPENFSLVLEGFGPVEVLQKYIAKSNYATQLGLWGRQGLGPGNPDNPIKYWQIRYTYNVAVDDNASGTSNPRNYNQKYATHQGDLIVSFDVTNARASAAYDELTTILLGTKTPVALYLRKADAATPANEVATTTTTGA